MVSLQNQVLNTPEEMHAAQDGVLVAILFTLPLISPQLATVLFGVLGISGCSKKFRLGRVLKAVDELIRTEEIQDNPEYFALPFLSVSGVLLWFGNYIGAVDPSVLVF